MVQSVIENIIQSDKV